MSVLGLQRFVKYFLQQEILDEKTTGLHLIWGSLLSKKILAVKIFSTEAHFSHNFLK